MTTKSFMTLEEFLLLRDVDIPLSTRMTKWLTQRDFDVGLELVNRYRIAQSSFNVYGADGPPDGTKVYTLVSGHGGGPGMLKTLKAWTDGNCWPSRQASSYFLLTSKSTTRLNESLCPKRHWYVHIVAEHMVDFNRVLSLKPAFVNTQSCTA